MQVSACFSIQLQLKGFINSTPDGMDFTVLLFWPQLCMYIRLAVVGSVSRLFVML